MMILIDNIDDLYGVEGGLLPNLYFLGHQFSVFDHLLFELHWLFFIRLITDLNYTNSGIIIKLTFFVRLSGLRTYVVLAGILRGGIEMRCWGGG